MTSSSAIGWFFGENGSIDGGMTQTRASSIKEGTYERKEKTYPAQPAR
jgi:hypothetical protein